MENKTSKGGVLLKSIIIVAILIIAYLVAVNYIVSPDLSLQEGDIEFATIQGFVGEVDQDKRSFEVFWVDEGETDSGLGFYEEYLMTVRWDDGKLIEPHHPGLLQGGEEVVIVPTQVWDENTEEVYIDTLEILSGLRG
ncbi:MAG: hypothetical protein WD471_00965 [Candidatus Paceibacterota bacterium]